MSDRAKTITYKQASEKTRYLWERLQNIQTNEQAWAIIEEAFSEEPKKAQVSDDDRDSGTTE